MGRLVPGLPGIQQAHKHIHTHALFFFFFLLVILQYPPLPPLLWKYLLHFSSNLTFFSGADLGRPTLFPTARQKPALWSEPEPLRWFFSLLALATHLPDGSTLLIYSSTNAVCLCFAPPPPRSLIFRTLAPFIFPSFQTYFLSHPVKLCSW